MMAESIVECLNKSAQKQLIALASLYYFVNRNKLLTDIVAASNDGSNALSKGKYYNILKGTLSFDRSSGYISYQSEGISESLVFGTRLPEKGKPSILYPYLNTTIRAFATSIYLENLEKHAGNNSTKLLDFNLKSQVEDIYNNFFSKLNSGKTPSKKTYSATLEKLAIYCGYDSWVEFLAKKPKHSGNESYAKQLQDFNTRHEDNSDFDGIIDKIYKSFDEGQKREICFVSMSKLLQKLNFTLDILLFGNPKDKMQSETDFEKIKDEPIKSADEVEQNYVVDYFIPKNEILDIEFETNANLTITIITSNLRWAAYHHKKIKDIGIHKANNKYKYILTGWSADKTYKLVGKLRDIWKELPDEPEKNPKDTQHIPNKSFINLLKIKDQFLTVYFEENGFFRDKIDAVDYTNYHTVNGFVYNDLKNSFILEKGAFFNPFDYIIIENVNQKNPTVKKYLEYSLGESENESKAFVIMEMNPMNFIEGDYSSKKLSEKMYYDTFVPLEVGEKIKIWAESVWKLFDEKIAPKGSKNRSKYFLLEAEK